MTQTIGALLLLVLGAAPSVFKTITLGTYASANELAQALTARGMGMSARPTSMMRTLSVSRARTQVDLVVVSVGYLGLPDNSKYPDIVAAARKLGLDLCPGEVGPQLRLQYTDQGEGETLRVAMEPIMSGITPVPTVFMLTGKNLLAGNSDFPFDRDVLWVFVRR